MRRSRGTASRCSVLPCSGRTVRRFSDRPPWGAFHVKHSCPGGAAGLCTGERVICPPGSGRHPNPQRPRRPTIMSSPTAPRTPPTVPSIHHLHRLPCPPRRNETRDRAKAGRRGCPAHTSPVAQHRRQAGQPLTSGRRPRSPVSSFARPLDEAQPHFMRSIRLPGREATPPCRPAAPDAAAPLPRPRLRPGAVREILSHRSHRVLRVPCAARTSVSRETSRSSSRSPTASTCVPSSTRSSGCSSARTRKQPRCLRTPGQICLRSRWFRLGTGGR